MREEKQFWNWRGFDNPYGWNGPDYREMYERNRRSLDEKRRYEGSFFWPVIGWALSIAIAVLATYISIK